MATTVAGSIVTPGVLALAAARGHDEIAVVRTPVVGVLVLGDVLAKLLGLFAYAALGRRLGGETHGAYGALEAAMAGGAR